MLAVSAALRLVARRIGVPHPVLLVLAGLALVFVPGLPRMEFDPEALFIVFVPPLLYWAALTTSLRDFQSHFWPIARYGTLVVLLTIGAVALLVASANSRSVDRLDIASGRRESIMTLAPDRRPRRPRTAFVTVADDPRVYAYVIEEYVSSLFTVDGVH